MSVVLPEVAPTGGHGSAPAVGKQLRQWRNLRRLSQLELAHRAGISPRHLSFVETGRATPSRQMILTLADTLDIPLRMRNPLLLAAGYAPIYPQRSWDSPGLGAVRAAVRQVLAGHEPYPALAVDRCWDLVDANRVVWLLTEGVTPELLAPPVNVLRMSLHPEGLARRVENLGQWRAHLLSRLRRQVEATADPVLTALYTELRRYPCPDPEPVIDPLAADTIVVPLTIRQWGRTLSFISTTTVFGMPLDVTVAELAVESFFPADGVTASALRSG